MPGRPVPLVTGNYYHIFNRGNDKRIIFTKQRDYERFKLTFYYYQFSGFKPRFSRLSKEEFSSFQPSPDKKLVDIICYCLMPNHFHFLVKQLKENGIRIFISQLSNSYTKYFNTKYKHIGALLQGVFKSVLVETDEQFVHVSRYIHLNPIVAGITNDLNNYAWSSYNEYIKETGNICNKTEILKFFPKENEYKNFIDDRIAYGQSLELIKHQAIDLDEP